MREARTRSSRQHDARRHQCRRAVWCGITICVSSGDVGASWSRIPWQLGTEFPANIPSVVAVGATALRNDPATGKLRHETSNAAMGDFITSGGCYTLAFTNISDFPWQSPLFAAGPWTHTPARITPDVSALGAFIFAVIEDQNFTVSGTSASSPMTAALLTLVNNELLNSGKPTLRNAVSFFYSQDSKLFTDVNGPYDNCFGRSANGANYAVFPKCYRATKGFDMTTGWGEPIFPSSSRRPRARHLGQEPHRGHRRRHHGRHRAHRPRRLPRGAPLATKQGITDIQEGGYGTADANQRTGGRGVSQRQETLKNTKYLVRACHRAFRNARNKHPPSSKPISAASVFSSGQRRLRRLAHPEVPTSNLPLLRPDSKTNSEQRKHANIARKHIKTRMGYTAATSRSRLVEWSRGAGRRATASPSSGIRCRTRRRSTTTS